MTDRTFRVPDMSCGHCKAAVEGELNRLPGVESAIADIERGTVEVSYDEGAVSTGDLELVIGTALGWSTLATIALAVVLAFFFGYLLTMLPLLRSGLALGTVLPIAFAADTISITIMEIVDNLIILVIPGAMEAGLASLFFWGSLAFALAVAFVAAFPVNRWLISRGKGHAVVHDYHHGHHDH
jgi:copper chaperone CopZ